MKNRSINLLAAALLFLAQMASAPGVGAAEPAPAAPATAATETSAPAVASQGVSAAPSVAAGLSLSAAAPLMVDKLLRERDSWNNKSTGIIAPLGFLGGGLLLGALSIGAIADDSDAAGGYVVAGVGAAAVLTGIILFAMRTSEERKQRELQRIDLQLRLYGVQARIEPWVAPAKRPSSMSAGLQLTFGL